MTKILLITEEAIAVTGVDAVGWEDDIPNVADYDVLVLDLVSLHRVLVEGGMRLDKVSKPRQGEVNQLLQSDGMIIAVMPAIPHLGTPGRHISPYWWSPIPLENVLQKGDTRKDVVPRCERYFEEGVGTWESWIRLEEEARPLARGLIRFELEPLAKSRFDVPLAGSARMRIYEGSTRSGFEEVSRSGSIIVLPSPDQVRIGEGLRIILEDFLGLSLETPPPRWVASSDYPGEHELLNEIEELARKRDQLKMSIREVKARLHPLQMHKRLLFEDGDALEDAVTNALQKLGAVVHESDVPGKEDRWFEVEGLGKAAAEIKGHKGSMTTADARQTDDWVQDLLERKGEAMKGVLLGNPYRNDPPDERLDAWPPDVVRYAEARGIALVTTRELYDALVSAEKGELDPLEFLRAIYEADGSLAS